MQGDACSCHPSRASDSSSRARLLVSSGGVGLHSYESTMLKTALGKLVVGNLEDVFNYCRFEVCCRIKKICRNQRLFSCNKASNLGN